MDPLDPRMLNLQSFQDWDGEMLVRRILWLQESNKHLNRSLEVKKNLLDKSERDNTKRHVKLESATNRLKEEEKKNSKLVSELKLVKEENRNLKADLDKLQRNRLQEAEMHSLQIKHLSRTIRTQEVKSSRSEDFQLVTLMKHYRTSVGRHFSRKIVDVQAHSTEITKLTEDVYMAKVHLFADNTSKRFGNMVVARKNTNLTIKGVSWDKCDNHGEDDFSLLRSAAVKINGKLHNVANGILVNWTGENGGRRELKPDKGRRQQTELKEAVQNFVCRTMKLDARLFTTILSFKHL